MLHRTHRRSRSDIGICGNVAIEIDPKRHHLGLKNGTDRDETPPFYPRGTRTSSWETCLNTEAVTLAPWAHRCISIDIGILENLAAGNDPNAASRG